MIDYQNIIIINQTNHGVTAARRNGVKHSHGDYIYFLDADDTIEPTAIESLVKQLSEDTDIVIGGASRNGEISPEDYRKSILELGWFSTGPVQKLYRRGLFDNEEVLDIDRSIVRGEDLIMLMRIGNWITGKIILTIEDHYNYRQHDANVTKTFKTSTDFETKFYAALIESFSSSKVADDYIVSLIRNRLSAVELILLGETNRTHTDYKHSEWFQHLKHDIQRSGYRLSLWQRVILTLGSRHTIRPLRVLHKMLKR